MQILDRIKRCNGCSACIVGCKERCMKMIPDEKGNKYPFIEEGGCNRCNNCVLYCPEFMPLTALPSFDSFYIGDNRRYYDRDMPRVYREIMRQINSNQQASFVGTMCQIAGLISLMGDRLSPHLHLAALWCDVDDPARPECAICQYWPNHCAIR